MDEADRLRPLLPGGAFIGGGEIPGAHSRQRRLEGMVRRPPDLRGQVMPILAERLDGDWKEDRLADRRDFWLETLLQGLLPERREVRRQHHTGDDLATGCLECTDLGRKIVGEVLIATGIGKLVATLLQHWRKTDNLVAPGVAVAVVWKQSADGFVGRDLTPHVGEDGDHVLKPPEEMIGVVE